MDLFSTTTELRQWRRAAAGQRIVLVPTMGALHAGHVHLVRVARQLAGPTGQVGVSIFVNPLQFGPQEDFSRYPRELEADAAQCAAAGADVIFAPPVEEVYAPDRSIMVLEKSLSTQLCGASRPGHFDGVCTVVAKLFNYFQPEDAVFGKKDFQQLAIIRRLVRDLSFSITLHGVDTVREADGLAMSSRNRYLTAEERAQAPALRQALLLAQQLWHAGQRHTPALEQAVVDYLATHAPAGRVDYASLVCPHTLQSLPANAEQALLALAVFFGKARLIDNLELHTAPSITTATSP